MPPRPKYRIFQGNNHLLYIGYLAGATFSNVQYRPILNDAGEPLSFTSNRAARQHIDTLIEADKHTYLDALVGKEAQ
jgi:hypothetical protein